MNVTAFLREFREYGVSLDHADALAFDRWRDAQGLDDAEFTTLPTGYTDCTTCGLRISNASRLDCGRCAS